MLRICKMTALAAATLAISTAAQAGPNDVLATRIHDAAVTACAPERVSGGPRAHYGAIEDQCVYRLSHAAMTKVERLANTGAGAQLANK